MEGPLDRWRQLRDDHPRAGLPRGFDPELNSFVQSYGSKELDASLLMIPLVGFLPASDPRVRGTVAAIERKLMRDGFVERYTTCPAVEGLPPGEGVFLACTFWLADNLVLLGRRDEARQTFERAVEPVQRRGPALRGIRPADPPPGGQLPPSLLPRRAGQHGHESVACGAQSCRAAASELTAAMILLPMAASLNL